MKQGPNGEPIPETALLIPSEYTEYWICSVPGGQIALNTDQKSRIEAALENNITLIYVKDLMGAEHIIPSSKINFMAYSTIDIRRAQALLETESSYERQQLVLEAQDSVSYRVYEIKNAERLATRRASGLLN